MKLKGQFENAPVLWDAVENAQINPLMLEKHMYKVKTEIMDSHIDGIKSIISEGIEKGYRYDKVGDKIQRYLGVKGVEISSSDSEKIAVTETHWSINEGRRQSFQNVGIKRMKIDVALTACEICSDMSGETFPVDQTDVCPVHTRCRCALVPVFNFENN